MLQSLSIKNYALIDSLQITFEDGFSIITGETGAGKSILLGGLSLILGKRADLNSLRDKDKKCVIEADFKIGKYGLSSFFEANDLDFDKETIIRREILPSGKSRAFINDSPVTLSVLQNLGTQLIDIHSQHQTLELTQDEFQLKVIDAVSENDKALTSYSQKLKHYSAAKKELKELLIFQENSAKEEDYNTFLLKELVDANLKSGKLATLEVQYESLSNVETIKEHIAASYQLLGAEQSGILTNLAELKNSTNKLQAFGKSYEALFERVNSLYIEADDVFSEVVQLQDGIEDDPKLLGEVNDKLQLIYTLQKKHSVLEEEALIAIRDELQEKVSLTAGLDEQIAAKEAQVNEIGAVLDGIAAKLNTNRAKSIPKIKKQLEASLAALGMPNASFDISLEKIEEFTATGKDKLHFLFSANKGMDYGLLKKTASGGELSRIMLTIKAILAKYINLPTIMLDEIDSGVSGEVSQKMADIMQEMSTSMQVFSITHLPQVASKGKHHYKVFKDHNAAVTKTQLKKLTTEERVVELAEMLGGKELSDSAIAHAKQLLN